MRSSIAVSAHDSGRHRIGDPLAEAEAARPRARERGIPDASVQESGERAGLEQPEPRPIPGPLDVLRCTALALDAPSELGDGGGEARVERGAPAPTLRRRAF